METVRVLHLKSSHVCLFNLNPKFAVVRCRISSAKTHTGSDVKLNVSQGILN